MCVCVCVCDRNFRSDIYYRMSKVLEFTLKETSPPTPSLQTGETMYVQEEY
jgi:hypothetical protein